MNQEDKNKKYKRFKIASIISGTFVVMVYLIMNIWEYHKERNTFEDLSQSLDSISADKEVENENAIISKEELDNQYSKLEAEEVPIDEKQYIKTKDAEEQQRYYQNIRHVVKYFFSLAIQGEEDLFFYQFHPEIYTEEILKKDDPEIQNKYFNIITKDQTLENIRILDRFLSDEGKYHVKTELVYKEKSREKIEIKLSRNRSNHHDNHAEWYISSSIEEIIAQIEGGKH